MSYKRMLIGSLLPLVLQPTQAACLFAPSDGDDVYVCDSGTGTTLTDTQGSNTLILPTAGTGQLAGSVRFGGGADDIQVYSGGISGNVEQGAGIDRFFMSGGSIGSLNQGDGRDQFVMTGGTIVGAFEDGDVAEFSGGTIGRVDMKLDNNIFVMSGGTILGNLVTGLGRDTIVLSGGRIGGNISMSAGTDSLTITGGEVGGQVLMSTGDDRFTWDGGGTIKGVVSLGDGNDTARLANLDESILGPTPLLVGNLGNDTLIFDHSTLTRANRYQLWENVNLTNASTLDLADTLTLGDPGSLTGNLNIDASSTLGATTGVVTASVAGQNVTVTNAGLVDLSRGGTPTLNRLTVVGNYVGDNGNLRVQSLLAGDDAASDQLVVAQGTLSGTTALTVTNAGGLGALTTTNGIQVVQATQGATSSDAAFSLANNLSAGAYQYYLFKGGVTAGTENSWFLRSSVVAPAAPPASAPAAPVPPETPVTPTTPATPTAPVTPTTPTTPATPVTPTAPTPPTSPATPATPVIPTAPTTPGTPVTPAAPTTPTTPVTPAQPVPAPASTAPVAAVGTPVLPVAAPGEAIPLYRVEVPVYAAVPPAAALLAQAVLGTFHERQGDQNLLGEQGALPAGWARAFGSQVRQGWSGAAAPTLDGSFSGYQVGHDLYASGERDGYRQHMGVFVSHAHLSGDVKGFALGFQGEDAGNLSLDADSLGAYWTLLSPGQGYVDAVVMGTRFDGQSRSVRGWTLDLHGRGASASVEAGYPIPLSSHWALEPQAQVLVQKIQFDSADDPVSRISFHAAPYWRGRVGARLAGDYQVGGVPLQPWLRANLWHTFGGEDTLAFDHADRLASEHRATTADVGAGVSARLSQEVSVYLSLSYSQQLDSQQQQALAGTVGLRLSW